MEGALSTISNKSFHSYLTYAVSESMDNNTVNINKVIKKLFKERCDNEVFNSICDLEMLSGRLVSRYTLENAEAKEFFALASIDYIYTCSMVAVIELQENNFINAICNRLSLRKKQLKGIDRIFFNTEQLIAFKKCNAIRASNLMEIRSK